MQTEGDTTIIEAKAPVAQLFGFAGDLRSATEGRAMWSTEFAGFETIPGNILTEIVMDIRKRKGLKLEMPKPSDSLIKTLTVSPRTSMRVNGRLKPKQQYGHKTLFHRIIGEISWQRNHI